MVNIFVYGTLKRGEPNHWLIKKLANHARFLSVAETRDKLPLVIESESNAPVLLNRPGEGLNQIEGQVYAVNEPGIAVLDRFCRKLERTKVHVVLLNKFLAGHTGDQERGYLTFNEIRRVLMEHTTVIFNFCLYVSLEFFLIS